MGRGKLTEEIKNDPYIKNRFGREITLKELRLFPYLQYLAVNDGKLDRAKITPSEMNIIKKLKDDGYLITEPRVIPSKELWDLMCRVIYKGYVDYEQGKQMKGPLSLCKNCWCMSYTTNNKCNKCGEEK